MTATHHKLKCEAIREDDGSKCQGVLGFFWAPRVKVRQLKRADEPFTAGTDALRCSACGARWETAPASPAAATGT